MSQDVDVAVVGAGLSGLSAARRLKQQGASIVVLEARDRVGGKMFTAEVGGWPVDLGAHWVGPTQKRVLALARELGIEVEKQYVEGRHVLTLDGDRYEYTGLAPLASPLGLAETALAVARVELRRSLVRRDDPWRSRGARRLDSYTLGHWMEGLRSRAARGAFVITARTVFGAEPSELSYLYFLWYAQCAGGILELTGFEGAAQDAHLRGGSMQVCERLAGELGDAVVLGSPVSRIAADEDGVVVTSGERTVRARRVIVAVSPAIAARIDFEPALPPPREALAQRMPMGAYMKGIAVYERAWWRDRGLSGMAFADTGPVQMVVDVGPAGRSPGVLAGFITGGPAREVGAMAEEPRREAVLAAMAALVGQEASAPVAYRDFNWHWEHWSRGGPVGLMGPGTVTGLASALREPFGPIHWAGTDTATEWMGFMEGAIQAGERAAAEVV